MFSSFHFVECGRLVISIHFVFARVSSSRKRAQIIVLCAANLFGANLDTAHINSLLLLFEPKFLFILSLPVVHEGIHLFQEGKFAVVLLRIGRPLLSELFVAGATIASDHVPPDTISSQQHLLGGSEGLRVHMRLCIWKQTSFDHGPSNIHHTFVDGEVRLSNYTN